LLKALTPLVDILPPGPVRSRAMQNPLSLVERLDAVFPPMATVFKDGEVDGPAIAANVTRWIQAGAGGVVALGSNGEAPLVEDDEAEIVIGAARGAVPRDRVLIAGTGRESTRATIAASRRAAALGADAVLVRTPSYFKARMTPDVLIRHYMAVADSCPVPVLLYNVPAVTGVNLAADTIGRLSRHPNIIGVKETGSDTAQVAAFVAASPGTFAVIAGSAPTFYPSLCVGATGGILAVSCVVPELCVRLHEHFRAGRHADARDLQQRLTPLARLVTTGHGVPGLKQAMELAGFAGGEPRAPLQALGADATAEIRGALAQLMSGVATATA
jgi:4-hydroxy-2-oxoglutarate aldolase